MYFGDRSGDTIQIHIDIEDINFYWMSRYE